VPNVSPREHDWRVGEWEPGCIPRVSRPEERGRHGHLRAKCAGLAEPEKLKQISSMAGRTGLEPGEPGDKPPES